jgi:hypothetical protein
MQVNQAALTSSGFGTCLLIIICASSFVFIPTSVSPPATARLEKEIEKHIGADNGYQPYYPTVFLELRYPDGVIAGIRRKGLVAR